MFIESKGYNLVENKHVLYWGEGVDQLYSISDMVGVLQSHKFFRDPIQKKPSAVFVIVLAEKSAEGFSV